MTKSTTKPTKPTKAKQGVNKTRLDALGNQSTGPNPGSGTRDKLKVTKGADYKPEIKETPAVVDHAIKTVTPVPGHPSMTVTKRSRG